MFHVILVDRRYDGKIRRINYKNKHKKTNAGLIGEPACLITLHQQTKSCRRGTRTAHGAVSYSTTASAVRSGGQPQSPLRAALYCVYPLSPPPRQEGTSANFDTLQCEYLKGQEDRRVTPLDQLDNANIISSVYTLQISHKYFLKFMIHSK